MITGWCSQTDFNCFQHYWKVFVRNYHDMDVDEVREQLLDCPDAALKEVVYRALGSDVVTITQADLLKVIKILVVVEVEETVYDALGSEVDTLSPTDLIWQIEELGVMVVDEDMKQTMVPQVEILPLYGRAQEGGAQQKLIPKTVV